MGKDIGPRPEPPEGYTDHRHEWQPAGIWPLEYTVGSILIFMLCACGEVDARQWDL